ncbi:PilZ domain-containing protein [Roseateles sp. BYS78W]|uniref:PilZ domain-containing protein n=1 Tax=Pelomonas candidula TaxID=3299025 RepID=A0ABW7HE81_9BURK
MEEPDLGRHRETIISTERRQFARVAFAAGAELITTQALLRCQVVDISLKGVLLQLPTGSAPQAGMPCLVKLPLSTSGDEGADVIIAMAGELAHVEGRHAGVLCRSIDLESITHLRRLIEVNLGDPAASERELKALIAAARHA